MLITDKILMNFYTLKNYKIIILMLNLLKYKIYKSKLK